MEVPEYEDRGTCLRLIRALLTFLILSLLGYSLWRIQVIESALEASDRFANITRLLNHQPLSHRRTERSVSYKSQLDLNSVDSFKKPTNKNEFDLLVNELYDKIQSMHNDTDRANFDRNIKAVFNAWFPVFDALLRHEMSIEEQAASTWRSRGIKQHESDEHSSEELERRDKRQIDMDDSDESDEPVDPRDKRQIESDESEERKKSSEEHGGGGNKRKKPKSREVSSEEKRNNKDKNRWGRSAEDSVSSSEEKKNYRKSLSFAKKNYYKQSDESSQESKEKKQYKHSDESSQESKEKFYYHIVT